MITFLIRRATLAGAFCLCTLFNLSVFGQAFTEISTSLPGIRFGSVSWGDYDNDGDLDLLVAGETASGVITRIYRNDGAGVFTDIAAGLPGISDGAAAWGDYNGDGFLDIAVIGGANISRIYRNNTNGTFTNINASLPGLGSATLAWGDYDNDGDLDLFITGYDGVNYVGGIFRNNGGDTFANSGVTTIKAGASPSAAWGDYDKDGDLDLLFAGFTSDTSSGQSSRLFRNSNGVFTNVTAVSLTAMSEVSLAWGDYDNDGDLDILMAGSSISGVQSFPTFRLYRNNNGTNFTSIVTTGIGGMQNCSVAWGDYDNDGDLDIAMAGYNASFQPASKIYRNDGGGFFTDIAQLLPGVIDASLAWGDYDQDGDLDLILTGHTGTNNITKLYRNESGSPNSPPFEPFGLFASASGKTATLIWGDSGDLNQAGGASFNLRVGTAPGSNDIMSAMANSTSGFRRAPRLGNVNEQLSWTLKLAVGTYYWSVQAIDHSWAGSPFPVEQSFQILPQAPDVITIAATNILPTGATLRASANPNGDATTVYFEYGTTTNYGSVTASQPIGSGVVDLPVTETLTNLLSATTYQFRAVAANAFGTTYGSNSSFVTPIFLEFTNATLLGVGGGSVAWGDYDSDGYLDLVVAGANSTGVVTRVYHNNAGTNFADTGVALPGINSGAVTWGDYDNDGDLDLLLTGNFLSRIYRNDGSNVFTDLNAGLPALSTGASAAWADYDNDGDLDFALTGAGGLPIKTYRNDGNDQFVDVPNSLPKLSQSSMAWADYDNDGDQDLLFTGYNYGAGGLGEISRLYRNDGRGNFTNSNISFQSVADSSVAWGDYDNDGDPDILLSGSTSSGFNRYSIIYSNNGAGTFLAVPNAVLSAVPKVDQSSVSWGDYDNDGDLDLLVVGASSTGAVVRVFRNDGNVFRDSGAVLPTLSSARAAWGDFDNDGRLDIALEGYTGSNYVVKIFRNLSPTANTPPTAPGGLTTTVSNNAAILGWNATTDANQPGGFTYNFRIGTAPGTANIAGPMANLATGYRRVPRLGNTTERRAFTITNLLVGTYYWSVQAVDHDYAGSTFSTNGSFVITAALLPPTAITRTTTNVGVFSASVGGVANPKGALTTAYVQFGTTTNFGSLTASTNLGSGTTNIDVAFPLAGLSDGTTYYYRLVASNVNGTVNGATFSFITQYQFTNVPTALPGVQYSRAAWGDYDNDNDLDLVVQGSVSGIGIATVLFRNDNGVFTNSNAVLPAAWDGDLAWGDYDRDGDLDILISGVYSGDGVQVLRNDGNGVFTPFPVGFTGYAVPSVAWGDFDNDGALDILLCTPAPGGTLIFRNNGNAFEPVATDIIGVDRGAVAWADYDRDGDLDLVVSGRAIINGFYTSVSRIYRNDGNRVFTDIAAPLPPLESSAVAWGDYDRDGDLDLLLSGFTTNSTYACSLFRNDNGVFNDSGVALPNVLGSVAWGDYDNDGAPDILICGSTFSATVSTVYRNAGGGIFTAISPTTFQPGYEGYWVDYDRDGKLDVLLTENGLTRLYRNNGAVSNTVPTSPAGLNASLAANRATLRWLPASDLNQTNALSYNLRVGKTPGAVDVVSPMSATNGFRRVSARGAINATNAILDLNVGTYYWSVQAVDEALGGSPFSSEASFVVPAQAPKVITWAIATNDFGLLMFPGDVNPNGAATVFRFEFGPTASYGGSTPWQSVGSGISTLAVSNPVSSYQPGVPVHYRLVASNSFGVSLGNDQVVTPPSFVETTKLLFPGSQSMSWGDVDNDGDLDLIGHSLVLRNQNSRLTNNASFSGGNGTLPPGLADYDGDGDVDLISIGNSLIVGRNESGSFITTNLFSSYSFSGGAWADYDNDGDMDVLYAGNEVTRLFRNDGFNVFTPQPTNVFSPMYSAAVAWADYDLDGDMDVALTGTTNGVSIFRIYRNDNHGAFTDLNAALPAIGEGSLAWGDYDNDGDPDLLVTGTMGGYTESSNFVTHVYRNDGGTFTNADVGLPGIVSGAAAWGDYDNDGWLDISLSGTTNASVGDAVLTAIYHNNGNGTFSLAASISPPINGYPRWGDYDGDGRLDLWIGFISSLPRLFHNNMPPTNSPPHTPAIVSSVATNHTVVLTWTAATDDNQSGGLSYNVRIGTSPGSDSVFSSLSAASNGWRRVPQIGNVGERLSWTITNNHLGGTYYWSVQSVDHSFAGSAFAPEASFTLPPIAPEGLIGPMTNILSKSATFTGMLFAGGAPTSFYFEYGPTTNYGTRSITQPGGAEARWTTVSANVTNLSVGTTYHGRLVSYNSVGTNYSADVAFTTLQFLPGTNLPANWDAGSVTWGDYDNDGRLDAFVTFTDYFYRAQLYHNDGNGNFSDSGLLFQAFAAGSADWGDYDNDGYLDLAVMGGDGVSYTSLRIFRNNGNGTFTNAVTLIANNGSVSGNSGSVKWGDCDNDGDLDLLVVASTASFFTKVYRNNAGQFTEIATPMLGMNGGSGDWGDFDKDGDLDVLIAGYTFYNSNYTNLTQLYLNDGTGTFTLSPHFFTGINQGFARFADLDNDGDLDLLVSGATVYAYGSPNITKIYRNNAGASFTEITNSLPGLLYSRVAIGDYNNDGRADLYFNQWEGFSRLYRNEGGFVFTDTGITLPTGESAPVSWADFDNDGDLDYLQTRYVSPAFQAFFYRNQSPVSNSIPNPPTGLAVTVLSSNSATLTWQPAGDPNQSGGLTYNLRIGTSPGAANIVNPMAAPNGAQKAVRFGNAQHTLSWTFTNLPAGTRYWSVQAIDNSFAGSAFAPEQSFDDNVIPVATPQFIVMAEDTTRVITLTGTDGNNQPLTFTLLSSPTNGVLTGSPPSISYRPATNFFGVDHFTFRANDGLTNSPAALVSLIVTQIIDVPFSRVSIQITNKQPRLTIIGEPFEHYRLEASEDLVHWIPLTNVVSSNGIMAVIDADALLYPKRFYRGAVVLPQAAISQPLRSASGAFQMNFAGEPSRRYEIEASTNLVHWTPLTNILLETSPVTFVDPNATNYSRRFYRVRWVP